MECVGWGGVCRVRWSGWRGVGLAVSSPLSSAPRPGEMFKTAGWSPLCPQHFPQRPADGQGLHTQAEQMTPHR